MLVGVGHTGLKFCAEPGPHGIRVATPVGFCVTGGSGFMDSRWVHESRVEVHVAKAGWVHVSFQFLPVFDVHIRTLVRHETFKIKGNLVTIRFCFNGVMTNFGSVEKQLPAHRNGTRVSLCRGEKRL